MLSHITYFKSSTLPWVTFLEGAGGIPSVWDRQIQEFKLHYNVLILHLKEENGLSIVYDKLNVDTVANEMLTVLDYKDIRKTHLIALSLGTVFIRNFALKYPKRTESIVLAGGIVNLRRRFHVLFKLKRTFDSILSDSTLFKFFAFILLPNRNHRDSRSFLVKQSRTMNKEELMSWAEFSRQLQPLLEYIYSEQTKVPTLYVMGEEDHLFLKGVKRASSGNSQSLLFIIQDCGHMVNREQPLLFNKMVIGYLVGMERSAENNFEGVGYDSKCSSEEVLIANSNNHSKK